MIIFENLRAKEVGKEREHRTTALQQSSAQKYDDKTPRLVEVTRELNKRILSSGTKSNAS